MTTYKRILTPVDFSPFSKAALDEAVGLASTMRSQLCVLHVYQNPAYVLPMSGYVGPASDVIAETRKQLGQELEALVRDARARGVNVETMVIEGVPHSAIVDHAKEWSADLIVMGTHGRTGLAHALTGSVTERVLRLAPCPVLVTRGQRH